MSVEMIGILGIVVLLILLALKMWVGAAMTVVGFVGIVLIKNFRVALSVLSTAPFINMCSYTFTVIPLFTLMGMVIAETRLGKDLYAAAYAWLGRLRGGLASATVVACGILGAVCGSANIGVLIMSRVALPEMKKNNYDETFAAGATAAGAPLSLLIPPSIGFMMYGILTENSIGKLFMSGIGVGVVQIILYIILIVIWCRIKPHVGPQGAKTSWKQKLTSLLKVIPMLLLMVLVLGGIYAGWFTTTEAGAIGAFGSIVISACFRQMTVNNLYKAIKDTAVLGGMIFFIMAATFIFVQFMSLSRVPALLASVIAGLSVPNWVIALGLVVIYFILGMFLPETPMVVLTVPVLYPALTGIGFDPIWLGCFVVKLMAVASVSPPVGMTVYTMAGVTRMPVQKIFKGVLPYLAVDVVILVLMIVFPEIATWLPGKM